MNPKKHLIIFIFLLALTFFSKESDACHKTSLTRKTEVNNGDGTFTITVNVCIGLKPNEWGTNNFTLNPLGGTFASIISLTTGSINSSYDYCVAGCSGSCSGTVESVTATATGSFTASTITFARSSSTPAGRPFIPNDDNTNCLSSNPANLCWDITFVTNGYPSTLTLDGVEDDVAGTGTASNGCPQTVGMGSIPCIPLTVSITPTNADCKGLCTGTAKATSSNGATPFTYQWDDASFQTTQTANNLCVGTYNVTVRDRDNCSGTQSVTIAADVTINLSSTTTKVDCPGGNNGSIDLTVSGGTPGYTYSWSNGGATTEDQSNLSEGFYFVTVTDAAGCIENANVQVMEVTPMSLSISTVDADCGTSNGSATVSVSNGNPGYTYLWSNGTAASTAGSLSAGTYTVTVTDTKGCTNSSTTNISNLGGLSVTLGFKQNVQCFGGNDGFININVSGGTAPLTYSWTNGATTQNISTLTAGIYTVTVLDNVGCQVSLTDTITEPPLLEWTSLTYTDVTCAGACNGSINIDVQGGTPFYSYSWSNGNWWEDQFGLCAANYTVTVTDANGCQIDTNQLITEPPPLTVTTSNTSASCGNSDGTATANPAGGTPPYIYFWDNGQTTQTATGLDANIYNVTVTDANGCTVSACVPVNNNPAPIIVVDSIIPVSCAGDDGAIYTTIICVGGCTPPLNILWSNGETTDDIDSLPPGTYILTVTDANGCKALQGCNSFVFNFAPSLFLNTTPTDANCNQSDGSAFVTVFGGTPPFQYQWSNGQTTDTAKNLAFGTYTIVVTDSVGCVDSATVNVGNFNAPNIYFANVQDISCFGANDGHAENYIWFGGTAPFQWVWSTGDSTNIIDSVGPALYSVTVTDANSCVVTDTVRINEPAILQLSETNVDLVCFGDSTGSIDLTVTGGIQTWVCCWVLDYNYSWSNGATTQDQSNLKNGTYTVTVTDNNGCTDSLPAVISQPAKLNNSFTTTVPGCGLSNGTAKANPTGGISPFTYLWSNAQTTQTATGLGVGIFSVIITDANNCTMTDSVALSNSGAPSFNFSIAKPSCLGNNDGSITVNASGGTSPYTYLWSNGATTATTSNLFSGTYSVVVTGADNCAGIKDTVLNDPPLLRITNFPINESCNGSKNGAINLTVNGGVPPYQYAWSTGDTTQDISGLSAGDYIILVADANFCTKRDTITVNQNVTMSFANVTTQTASCGATDGWASVAVSGGSFPYTYLWSDGQTSSFASNLKANLYSVSVTDFNNCSIDTFVIVNNADGPQIDSFGIADVVCNGDSNGSITLKLSGECTPFQSKWSNGMTMFHTGGTTFSIPNLLAGLYVDTLLDPCGCSTYGIFTITEPPPLQVSALVNAPNCYGIPDGSIQLNVSGGTPSVNGYNFLWSSGQTTQNLSNINAGNYIVTINDSLSCSLKDTISILPKDSFVFTKNKKDATCTNPNGEAYISISSGGIGTISYSWNSTPIQNNDSAFNLLPAYYVVTFTDSLGCTDTTGVSVNDVIPILSYAATKVQCNGDSTGNINLTVTNGKTPYSYLWSNGDTIQDISNLAVGTYFVTVTDANVCPQDTFVNITEPSAISLNIDSVGANCNKPNGTASVFVSGGTGQFTYKWNTTPVQTNDTAFNLLAGNYKIVVTDSLNCKDSANVTVNSIAIPFITHSITDVVCNGDSSGAVDITVTNGTPFFNGYKYSWTNGDTIEDINGLKIGLYIVTVSDTFCQKKDTAVITEPPAFILSDTITDVKCFGENNGAIDITVGGATPGYTYLWSDGNTSEDISNHPAGTYFVIITDSSNCKDSIVNILINQPPDLVLDTTITNVLCNSGNTGAIDLIVIGGTAGFSFSWSNSVTTQDLNNLIAGNYSVIVTDNNNCQDSLLNIPITEPPPIVLSDSVSDLKCNGDNSGAIDLIVSGGTPGYIFSWSNSTTAEDAGNLSAGIYFVIVTDTNNCKDTLSNIVINQPNAITLNSNVADVKCFGGNDGAIDLTVSGGTVAYTYLWSNGNVTEDVSNLSQGNYSVTVTDNNNCPDSSTAIINQPTEIILWTDSTDDCGSGNGTAETIASGGTSPYSYLWNSVPPQTSAIATDLIFGSYRFILIDANGCADTGFVTVDSGKLASLSAFPDTLITKGESVKLLIDNSNFTSIQWDPSNYLSNSSIANPIATPPHTTVYFATITASNSCTATDSLIIEVELCTENDLFVPNAFTPNGDNNNDILFVSSEDITAISYFRIYDRWGKMVFHTDNILTGWDGNEMNSGKPVNGEVFVYTLEGVCPDGNKIFKKGNVTVIR